MKSHYIDEIVRIKNKISENLINKNVDYDPIHLDTLINDITNAISCYKESKFLIYHKEKEKKIAICDDILIKCYLDIIKNNIK